ncbi:uncharacterized protein LOC144648389 [Oculina patagonica]
MAEVAEQVPAPVPVKAVAQVLHDNDQDNAAPVQEPAQQAPERWNCRLKRSIWYEIIHRSSYCFAEAVLEKPFLAMLKGDNELHRAVLAIVVDEFHTMEAWTGKRKTKSTKPVEVFRGAYGRLAILRSMCKDGTPVLALTGTADEETETTVIKELAMKDPIHLFVSPNRSNLRFSINKVSRTALLRELDWLVELIKKNGKDTPKTIVFCDTMYSMASVFNYLMMSLGEHAFHPNTSRKRIDCFIGLFHSVSHKEYKERLLLSFKNNGLKRVAIATTALSMGVNFPDVRYVVLFGPSRSLLDFHQEAGRAGRDSLPSDIVLYYYGQQLAHVEYDVHEFLKTEVCYRVATYKSLDPNIASISPPHDCCNICSIKCKCGNSNESMLGDESSNVNVEFVNGLEELLLSDYMDFQDDLPDPDALPE